MGSHLRHLVSGASQQVSSLKEVQRPLLVVTECKMVRDAVPLLLPVSEGRLPGGLPLVAGLRPAEHPHCLPAHLRTIISFEQII